MLAVLSLATFGLPGLSDDDTAAIVAIGTFEVSVVSLATGVTRTFASGAQVDLAPDGSWAFVDLQDPGFPLLVVSDGLGEVREVAEVASVDHYPRRSFHVSPAGSRAVFVEHLPIGGVERVLCEAHYLVAVVLVEVSLDGLPRQVAQRRLGTYEHCSFN